MEKEKPKKRISVEVEDWILSEIKLRALIRNMTVKEYITAIVLHQISLEKKYD